MTKTNPIGVRFRREILDHIKENFGPETPQSALVFMENFYRQYNDKISVFDALRDAPTLDQNAELEAKISALQTENEHLKGEIEQLKAEKPAPTTSSGLTLDQILAEAASKSLKK